MTIIPADRIVKAVVAMICRLSSIMFLSIGWSKRKEGTLIGLGIPDQSCDIMVVKEGIGEYLWRWKSRIMVNSRVSGFDTNSR